MVQPVKRKLRLPAKGSLSEKAKDCPAAKQHWFSHGNYIPIIESDIPYPQDARLNFSDCSHEHGCSGFPSRPMYHLGVVIPGGRALILSRHPEARSLG